MDLPANATVKRAEIKQGHITIAYGADTVTGYFISASDDRLAQRPAYGVEFNEFCDSISEDGEGNYMDAHTGTYGFGKKVDVETMKKLWELYGADMAGIKE